MCPTLGAPACRVSARPHRTRYVSETKLVVVVVAGQLGCELLVVELGHRHGRRRRGDVDEPLGALVLDPALCPGWDEHQIALAHLLDIAGDLHPPVAAD